MGKAKNKKRVLLLMHEDLVPPDDFSEVTDKEAAEMKTETDVMVGLTQDLGHDVCKLGLWDELRPLRKAVEEYRPHVVFNLLEEFRGEALFDQNVVAYLQLLGAPYTGCNPRGLVLARDKALSKKILHYHRIHVPRFVTVRQGRRPKLRAKMEFPFIVKSLVEEGSTAIAQASVVHDAESLQSRVEFIHDNVGTDAIVEEFVAGRELYVGLIGNQRVMVLPTMELFIDNLPQDAPRIATRKVKFDREYQEQAGVRIAPVTGLDEGLAREIARTARRIYRILELDGYARIDFRLSQEGRIYFLEANPNPDLAYGEELAEAAEAAGLDYGALLTKVINLGIRRAKKRKKR
jgi:D-alanine-D-alanine ligase